MKKANMAKSEAVAGHASPALIKKKSSFAGDVLKLTGGTTLAQALTILVAPILSRLYAPDAFGTAAVFASIIGIIGVVACLRYELAIMLPERDEDAANLLAVSLGFVLVITGLSTILILFAGGPILGLLNAPDLKPYLWLVPLATLVNGGLLALKYWNLRTKQFGRLSVACVTSSVVGTGTKLGAGFAGRATGGSLISAGVIGSIVATLVLGGQIWQDDRCTFIKSIRLPRMFEWAKRHRKFPIFNTWSALLNTASWQLPAFLLAVFFSPAEVGYYAVGNRVVQLPMNLIGSAIAQVFFQRASEARNVDGDLADVVTPLFRRLVAFGFFPMLLLMVIGQDVFIVVLGQRWSEAGVYMQILSLWMFVRFISSPLSTLFSVLERQEGALLLNTLIFTTRLIALGTGGMLGNARLALVLFAATGILVYGGLCAWILKTSGVSKSQAWSILFKYLSISVLIISPVAAAKLLAPASSFIVLAGGAVACGIYGFILLLHEESNFIERFRRLV